MSSMSGMQDIFRNSLNGASARAAEHLKFTQHDSNQAFGYGTRLLSTSIFVPGVAILFTIVFMRVDIGESAFQSIYSPLWGLLGAVLLWFIGAALIFRGLGEPEHAIPSSYGELHERLDRLEVALETISSGHDRTAIEDSQAYTESVTELAEIRNELQTRGMRWVLAQGYADIWSRLYKAEEALIDCEPIKDVLAGAYHDELRLDGSEVPNREDLLAKLRKAVEAIDVNACRYLKTWVAPVPPPPLIARRTALPEAVLDAPYTAKLRSTGGIPPHTWRSDTCPKGLMLFEDGMLCGTAEAGGVQPFSAEVTDATGAKATADLMIFVNHRRTPVAERRACPDSMSLARSVLREVRASVNEYRNGLWNGLIVARNRLLATSALMSVVVFLLLAVAIMLGATPVQVGAAAMFFIVGAAVGLGKRLRDGVAATWGAPDYGLSAAVLTSTPVFSGFCAVAGVVLVALLPLAGEIIHPNTEATQQHVNTSTPVAAEPPGAIRASLAELPGTNTNALKGRATAAQTPVLSDLFNLQANILGLFIAAIFGLTPELLFIRLEQSADSFKNGLRSSQASGRAAQA